MSDLGESDTRGLSPDDEPTEPEITVPMRVLVQRPVAKRTHASVDLGMALHSFERAREAITALFRDWPKLTHSERDLAMTRILGEHDNGVRFVDAVRGRL